MRDARRASAPPDAPYWSRDARALSAELGSGAGGLSFRAATAALRRLGPNSVEEASGSSALRLLLRQWESPLVLILIVAAAISLTLQQWVDVVIILAIVIAGTLRTSGTW
jgi:Mg2+-importing ATPase